MMKGIKILAQVAWAVTLVAVGTTVGLLYGWEHQGWPGAIVLGTIGFGVGACFASSPSLLLQLLQY